MTEWRAQRQDDRVICTFHPCRFNVSSGTVGKAGKETKGELPLIRMKVRHQTVNILPMDLYQDFIKVRVNDASLNSLCARFEQPQNMSNRLVPVFEGMYFWCVLCGGRGMGGGVQSFDTLGPIICRLLVGRWGSSSFIFVSDICKVPDNKMSPPVVCGDVSVNE